MKFYIIKQAGELHMLTEEEKRKYWYDYEIILEHDFKGEGVEFQMGFFRAVILMDEKYELIKK